MNLIAKKIKETRRIKGLTQIELAEKSSLNLRTIQRIENAKSVPRSHTLNLICNVLEIDSSDLILDKNFLREKSTLWNIAHSFFILIINLILVSVIGFLTLDSNANTNSLFGGVLLSIFIPVFIVYFTKEMNNVKRTFKFGLGYILYFFSVAVLHGLPVGLKTGLFPCLIISLFFLFFGKRLFK